MKIIAGKKKGAKILGPGPREIRPMRELVRRAMFDILRDVIDQCNFLDLFAGTGSVGLEALSRGARHSTFVDNFPEAVNLISKNLDELNFVQQATVLQKDVFEALTTFGNRDRRFDVVFAGPPYGDNFTSETLNRLRKSNIVTPGGVVATEVFKKNNLPQNFGPLTKVKQRTYGQNQLTFYRTPLE